jgi:hypothetical protein
MNPFACLSPVLDSQRFNITTICMYTQQDEHYEDNLFCKCYRIN